MLGYFAVFTPLVAFLLAGLLGKKFGDRFSQVVTCTARHLVIVASVTFIFIFTIMPTRLLDQAAEAAHSLQSLLP